jgi:hypothetical protein
MAFVGMGAGTPGKKFLLERPGLQPWPARFGHQDKAVSHRRRRDCEPSSTPSPGRSPRAIPGMKVELSPFKR